MTAHIARAREAGRKPRSAEYIERKRVREAERRRVAREAKGFATVEAFRKFACEQARKTRAARLAVIRPSTLKTLAMQSANAPGETVEQFLARGGVIHRCPGFTGIKPGPIPARHILGTGARAA